MNMWETFGILRAILGTLNLIGGAGSIFLLFFMILTTLGMRGLGLLDLGLFNWNNWFVFLFFMVAGESMAVGILVLKRKRWISVILAAVNLIFAVPILYLLLMFALFSIFGD